jgi:hypothetical protein
MFRAFLVHFQEALHKRHLVYSVRVMSVAIRVRVELVFHQFHSNPGARSQSLLNLFYDRFLKCLARGGAVG